MRVKVRKRYPRKLFYEKVLIDWKDGVGERKFRSTLHGAYLNLKRCPIEIENTADLRSIKGIGQNIAEKLENAWSSACCHFSGTPSMRDIKQLKKGECLRFVETRGTHIRAVSQQCCAKSQPTCLAPQPMTNSPIKKWRKGKKMINEDLPSSSSGNEYINLNRIGMLSSYEEISHEDSQTSVTANQPKWNKNIKKISNRGRAVLDSSSVKFSSEVTGNIEVRRGTTALSSNENEEFHGSSEGRGAVDVIQQNCSNSSVKKEGKSRTDAQTVKYKTESNGHALVMEKSVSFETEEYYKSRQSDLRGERCLRFLAGQQSDSETDEEIITLNDSSEDEAAFLRSLEKGLMNASPSKDDEAKLDERDELLKDYSLKTDAYGQPIGLKPKSSETVENSGHVYGSSIRSSELNASGDQNMIDDDRNVVELLADIDRRLKNSGSEVTNNSKFDVDNKAELSEMNGSGTVNSKTVLKGTSATIFCEESRDHIQNDMASVNLRVYSLTDNISSKKGLQKPESVPIETGSDGCGVTPRISYCASDFASSQVVLLADNREHHANQKRSRSTCEILAKKGIQFEMRSLSIGDYMWVIRLNDGREMVLDYIVERKTWDDLWSSIRKSRYVEQKQRLINSGISTIVYLIEGRPNRDIALEQAAVNLHIQHGFLLHRASNAEDSVRFLASITRMLIRKAMSQNLMGTSYENFHKQCKKTQILHVNDIFTRQLTVCPGMSTVKAELIVSRFPSFAALAKFYAGLTPKERPAALARAVPGIPATLSIQLSQFFINSTV